MQIAKSGTPSGSEPSPGSKQQRLNIIASLAAVLERIEHGGVSIDPDQYQLVVRRLTDELTGVESDAALRALFAASPAAAELYENINYQHAGLCLRPLDSALEAELGARKLFDRVKLAH